MELPKGKAEVWEALENSKISLNEAQRIIAKRYNADEGKRFIELYLKVQFKGEESCEANSDLFKPEIVKEINEKGWLRGEKQ